jgi:cell wall-associated NlpC family hydrolase
MRPAPGFPKVERVPLVPEFKIRSRRADQREMGPGGSVFRRRRRVAMAVIAIAGLWPLTQIHPADAAVASDGAPNYRVVERDTAPPAIPVVIRAALRAASSDPVVWSDVDSSYHWARQAIGYVAGTHTWMRDYPVNDDGTYPFRPGKVESRKYFARALVRAFSPLEPTDPSIVFTDLDPTSPFYPFANVAVKLGWMTRSADGAFLPDSAVTLVTVHRALVLHLGLAGAAHALNQIHTPNGEGFRTPPGFGTTVLGYRLGLRYNNWDESKDLIPSQPMPRAQVAYSLFRAATQPSWTVPELQTEYANVELPRLGAARRRLVQWGIRYAGYPYVWGGEWGKSKPEPAALGGQPIPGFDCSGLTWWLIRANDTYAWKVAPPRPYAGWSLPQRSSADMARNTVKRIHFADLRPGDMMFYDGNGDGVVDHVDTYIGNGFSLDSSSTPGGVTIMWVGDGWYRDHFVFGRRVLPA